MGLAHPNMTEDTGTLSLTEVVVDPHDDSSHRDMEPRPSFPSETYVQIVEDGLENHRENESTPEGGSCPDAGLYTIRKRFRGGYSRHPTIRPRQGFR